MSKRASNVSKMVTPTIFDLAIDGMQPPNNIPLLFFLLHKKAKSELIEKIKPKICWFSHDTTWSFGPSWAKNIENKIQTHFEQHSSSREEIECISFDKYYLLENIVRAPNLLWISASHNKLTDVGLWPCGKTRRRQKPSKCVCVEVDFVERERAPSQMEIFQFFLIYH